MRTVKKKYDGRSKPPWDGLIVEERGAWLAVYFPDPPTWKDMPGATSCAISFYSTDLPLSVLAALDESGTALQYQCDSGLPATLEAGAVSFVDLELDLIVDEDLNYFFRDEDQFQHNRRAMAYPAHITRAAWEGIRIADELIHNRSYPFDGSAERLAVELLGILRTGS